MAGSTFGFGNIIKSRAIIVSAAGTTILTNTSDYYQYVTGILTQTIQLPAANTMPLAMGYMVINTSTASVVVTNNGGTTLMTLAAGQSAEFATSDISTANGVWMPAAGAGTGGGGGGSGSAGNYFMGNMPHATDWAFNTNAFANSSSVTGTNTLTTVVSNGLIISAAASNAPGIILTPATASDVFLVRATFPLFGSTASAFSRLTDGTNIIGYTNGTTSENNLFYTIEGIYSPGNISANTIRIQAGASSGTVDITMDGSIPSSVPSIQWEVIQLSNGAQSFVPTNSATFTTVGASTWTVPAGVTRVATVLIGGGSGGGAAPGDSVNQGGGGGAGGGVYFSDNVSVIPGTTININVGAGGLGGVGASQTSATAGGSSSFGSTTTLASAIGINAAINSNSFGQGGSCNTTNFGLFTGGSGATDSINFYGGGGGAGAQANGGNAVAGTHGGNGGNGFTTSISGSPITYAGGGGAGASTVAAGTGGSGGGGAGGVNAVGSNGTANTGGGGGGAGSTAARFSGGNGGTGFVAIYW